MSGSKTTKIYMLGTVVEDGHTMMKEGKISSITNWETPTTVKQVKSFLGFANFYQQFIKDFSTIAALLHQLKGGERIWKWGDKQQQAFKAIKKAITSKLVLILPNDFGKFCVEVDTSNVGTGAVLSEEKDRKWHPVAFMSKALTSAERNYKIYNKELLAIIKALSLWQHY